MKSATTKTGSISWTLRLFTLLVWLLVGLCLAYWAFKFVTNKPVQATAALAAPAVVVDSQAVAKLLGATGNVAANGADKVVSTTSSSKFSLFGLANSANGQGFALIAIDGKPAKPYRLGSAVADDLVLKSIAKTSVVLAASLKAPDGVTLELPARKPASMVVLAPNTIPNASPNVASAPAVNTAVVPALTPPIASAAPTVIMPSLAPAGVVGALGAAGLSDRATAISRFAPQNADMATARQPLTAGSAVGDR